MLLPPRLTVYTVLVACHTCHPKEEKAPLFIRPKDLLNFDLRLVHTNISLCLYGPIKTINHALLKD